MLRRAIIALLACQVALAWDAAARAKAPSDIDSIRSLRNDAIEMYLRGNADSAMDMYEDCLRMALKAYGANSIYVADLYFDEGVIALNSSKFPKAEECLTQAVRLNPNSVTARVKLAEVLKVRGKTGEAIQQAQKAIAKHRDSLEAREMLALSYQEQGNIARAAQECFYMEELTNGKSAPAAIVTASAPPVSPSPPKPSAAAAPPAVQDTKTAIHTIRPTPAAEPAEKKKPAVVKESTVHAAAKQQPKASSKAPPKKPAPKPAKTQVAKAKLQPNQEVETRLKSKAVLLTKIKKNSKEKTAEASSQSPEAKPSPVEKPKPAATEKPKSTPAKVAEPDASTSSDEQDNPPAAESPPAKTTTPPKKVAKPKPEPPPKPKTPRGGLVPPPPPVVPVFPAMMVQPMAPPPAAKPKPRPAEKPRPQETAREDKGGHTSEGSGEDNSDFLLDWAGSKGKKKGN